MSLRISTAPHMHNPLTTQRLMQFVLIALLPAAAMGVYNYGMPALLVLAVSTVSAVLAEFIWQKIARKPVRVSDCSALVTGLILGLNLPATAPWWMVMIGSFFAIMIVKELFGGLGDNFLNPALAARAVLLSSWPAHMTSAAFTSLSYYAPPLPVENGAAVDLVTAGTPLAAKSGLYTLSNLFLGQIPGTIGEVCKWAILLGLAFLLITKTIQWRIPVITLASAFVWSWILGGSLNGALVSILSGGLMFGAVFMATDYVTSPITPFAQTVYAFMIGLIVSVIRYLNPTYPEGVTYAILLMNIATPLLDRFLPQKIYGHPKKEAK